MTFGGATRFTGDRYQRLAQGAAVLAADPSLATAAADPFNSAGLRGFTAACQRERVLDGLADDDADLVAMLLLMDFSFGLVHVADCLDAVVASENVVRRRDGRPAVDAAAAARAVAAALTIANVPSSALATEG